MSLQDRYDPAAVEAAAQSAWTAADAYRVTEDASRPKFYACSMLPYPSGKLHMGHVRNYTINDMLARQLRMRGFNVLMPMGWDAFGLPAENAALKNAVPPEKWTRENIAYMKGQMQAMGLAIDWSREVATCDPEYYKWNQWLFLKMLEAGIAERRTQVVNWDPVDQTVLANEQVIDGRGWRSGALVEKREIPGYYLNIVKYADELLGAVADPQDPNYLSGWPERVRLMQENWIGKSAGVRFAFPHEIKDASGALIQDGKLFVFTTRADTVMGVTFCAVAPEHPLAAHAAATNPALAAFIAECAQGGTTEAELATQEKKGMATGLFVTHPLTGAEVEVWVGNYVLMSYGDGAVMGVPAHDERDFAFAKKYGLEIKPVVMPSGWELIDAAQVAAVSQQIEADGGAALGVSIRPVSGKSWMLSWHKWEEPFGNHGTVFGTNSELDGLTSSEAVDKVAELVGAKGLGEKKITWRLRDWGISRQRYWGTPIPIIHCDACGPVPVPEQDLPVVLPIDCVPDGSGNPLKKRTDFLNVPCPCCGKPAQRETDTMDTFVDSSWYFMRYCDARNDQKMVAEGTDYWMPMDQYIGGIEHAILHLLYARFWTKVMRDLGLVKASEPFTKLLTQGMVLNHIYSRRTEKGGIEYFWPHEVENVLDAGGKVVGARLKEAKGDLPAGTAIDYQGVGTMSKSKNNGVDPQELINRYGADTARLFVMFAAPPEQTLEWNESAVEGAHRFIKRIWAFAAKNEAVLTGAPAEVPGELPAEAKALRREVHLVLRQVSHDFERMQYNTVVSGGMKLLNALEGYKHDGSAGSAAVLREGFSVLLRALYPACPHITWKLWADLGYAGAAGDLLDAPWPVVVEAALVQDEIELVLQVNGKTRGAIKVPAGADKAAIEATAAASPEVEKFSEGRTPKKIIVVPGRLVNVVV
ncbi:leucine--tRNA ligase [Sphaerotilus natans]|uniref:leucine--tRNA ligase n=1 Tax=Sphaerotilus natans TaxID=34103 RepID=UPI00406C5A73